MSTACASHDMVTITRNYQGYDAYEVVRWCQNCGAIRIDEDYDGRSNRGSLRLPIAHSSPQPAQQVPEGWKHESRRLIPLLQSFADRLRSHALAGRVCPELYEADHDELMATIRHLKQIAAAPLPTSNQEKGS